MLQNGEKLEYEYINLEISNMIINIFEKNIPYKWLPTTEPFINKYNGRLSYDKSGEVCRMREEDLKEIIKEIERKPLAVYYSSKLQELLLEIKLDSWIATYESNYGKHWISYSDKLEETFNNWKYENFLLVDEAENYIDNKLEETLDGIYYDFMKNAPYKFYSTKLLKEIKKNM